MPDSDHFTMRNGALSRLDDYSRTELIAACKEMHTLCSNLETIIENSQDSIFVTNGHGEIVKINRAYELLSGEERQNLIGKNLTELVGSLISESCTLRALKTRKRVTIEQNMFKTQRTAHVTTTPIFDSDGTIVMTISNNRDLNEIVELKERLADTESLANKYREQVENIRSQLNWPDMIVAHDKKMLDVLYRAEKIAKVDATVLILGETGAGKDQLVKYIHQASARQGECLIKINCGALTASLIESELFGYEKGAFTGADSSGKVGFFEAADKGILFLDEVGELPMEMQVKLLRVLQEGEFFRIGGTKPIRTNARIISATNRDLQEMVQMGTFRSDLYYRLNVASITVPPLRERLYDIIPLATSFLQAFNDRYGMDKTISVEAYQALQHYTWPGNVRELRNVIEQALILSESDTIVKEELPFAAADTVDMLPVLEGSVPLDGLVARMEATYVQQAYERHGNIRAAARSLGIKPTRFLRKLKKYRS